MPLDSIILKRLFTLHPDSHTKLELVFQISSLTLWIQRAGRFHTTLTFEQWVERIFSQCSTCLWCSPTSFQFLLRAVDYVWQKVLLYNKVIKNCSYSYHRCTSRDDVRTENLKLKSWWNMLLIYIMLSIIEVNLKWQFSQAHRACQN